MGHSEAIPLMGVAARAGRCCRRLVALRLSRYSNPALDRLFEEQSWVMDLAERVKVAHEIERIILTDLPVLPTALLTTYAIAWYPHVKDFTPAFTAYSSHIRMEYVWLDK